MVEMPAYRMKSLTGNQEIEGRNIRLNTETQIVAFTIKLPIYRISFYLVCRTWFLLSSSLAPQLRGSNVC